MLKLIFEIPYLISQIKVTLIQYLFKLDNAYKFI